MKSSSSSSSVGCRRKHNMSSYLFLLLVFSLTMTVWYGEEYLSWIFNTHFKNYYPHQRLSSTTFKKLMPFAVGEMKNGCDVFSGRWVWDNQQRPLYEEADCPYIPPQLTCQEHGRPDKDYQHWRWQPHGHACDLPSFNATLMLETLRDKRMMFVGDSLSRGQFHSMVCLVYRILPDHAKSMIVLSNDTNNVFTIKGYNATIEFFWAPFILESNHDGGNKFQAIVIRKGSINKREIHWKGVDLMVFNSYLWWIGREIKILQGKLDDEGNEMEEKVPTEEAYEMAIGSMVQWVNNNMDPYKTRVFFTSLSPEHSHSSKWGGDAYGNCYNETSMIEDPNYSVLLDYKINAKIMNVSVEMLRKSRYPITFLNITQLSGYRKDAHTSIYKKQWRHLTPQKLANPASYADCVHWCLPGIQDIWNELLFAKLFYP